MSVRVSDRELASCSRTHDTSRIPYHIKDLVTFGENLTKAAAAAFPNQGKTRYHNVYVLLLCWEEDNLGVAVELQELGEVFSQTYHFQTEAWKIPSTNSHNALAFRMMEFLRDHDDRENLLMIYYGGHGEMNDDRQCVWSCTNVVDSPTVQWYGLQTLLEQARSDVLLLLDCCAAASSAAASGNGVTELIAACGFESWAPGVGEHSFSRSLIEELKYLSYGPPFSAALLHNRVLSRIKYWKPRFTATFALERRKTPIYIQLANDLNQKSIQLGPLPIHSTGIDSNAFEQPTAQSSAESTESEDIEMLSPDSSQSSLAEVWPDPGFKCPKVLISVALEENQQLQEESWTEWLRSVPALAKYMQVQGVYESDSTLVLGLIPVAIWDLLPRHPAVSFVSFVRSDNLFKNTAPLTIYPSSVFKAADKFLKYLRRRGGPERPSVLSKRLRIRFLLDELIYFLERTTYSVDAMIGQNDTNKISSVSRRLRSVYEAVDNLVNANQKRNAGSGALILSSSEHSTARIHPRTLANKAPIDTPMQPVFQKKSSLSSLSVGARAKKIARRFSWGRLPSSIASEAFPQRLEKGFVRTVHDMLSDPELQRQCLVFWPDLGNTFAISQSAEFAGALAPYFHHTSLPSFFRQLEMYGFQRNSIIPQDFTAALQTQPRPKLGLSNTPFWQFSHESGKFRQGDIKNLYLIENEVFTNRPIYVDSVSEHLSYFFSSKSINESSLQDSIENPILHAVKTGDEALLVSLIAANYDVDARGDTNMSALHYAARRNDIRLVYLLLKAKADIEACDREKKSPLHLATETGLRSIMSLLLAKNANPEARDRYGKTPLHYAAEKYSSRFAVPLLLEAGAQVNPRDYHNKTPLHYAVQGGDAVLVELLLNRKADIEARGENTKTPLHYAVDGDHQEIVQLLLDRKADIEARGENTKTPLHYAVDGDHQEIVQILLDRKADIEAIGENTKTPLHYAVDGDHQEIVQLLLDRKADMEARTSSNKTPLHYAVERGYADIVELLLNRKANIDTHHSDDKAPLRYAVERSYTDLVELLLEKGADVEAPAGENKTPLHYAFAQGYTALVGLLSAGDNKTPLHYAAEKNSSSDIMRLLLRAGVRTDVRDRQGRTPLYYAVQRNRDDMARPLLDHDANPHIRDLSGKTPLDLADQNLLRSISLVRLLQKPSNLRDAK
ncbi:MAG: hypothetical protein Q9203_003400 [Teloschistes exilis]